MLEFNQMRYKPTSRVYMQKTRHDQHESEELNAPERSRKHLLHQLACIISIFASTRSTTYHKQTTHFNEHSALASLSLSRLNCTVHSQMEGSRGPRPRSKPCSCPSLCYHIHVHPILPRRALSPPLSKRSSLSSATNSALHAQWNRSTYTFIRAYDSDTYIFTVSVVPRRYVGFRIPLGSSELEYYDKRNLCEWLWEETERTGWSAHPSQPAFVHDPLLRLLLTISDQNCYILYWNTIEFLCKLTQILPGLHNSQRTRHNLWVLVATSVSGSCTHLFVPPLPVRDRNWYYYWISFTECTMFFTFIPFWHRVRANTEAILESFPTSWTFFVPGGRPLRTVATAKPVPSTIFTLSFGLFW